MHEAFWNGLLDVRWEDAPLGQETTRLVLRHARQDIIQWLEDLSAPKNYVKQNSPASHSFKPNGSGGPAQFHIISGFT
jgi:hypothetical protein